MKFIIIVKIAIGRLIKNMNDLKITISRSFSRKIQPEQYQPCEFFASYSEEILANTEPETMQRVSALLYGFAKTDVEQAIIDYKNEKSKAEELKNAEIKAEAIKRIEQGGWLKQNEKRT